MFFKKSSIFSIGKIYRIKGFSNSCNSSYRRKFFSLGFIPNSTFEILCIAPFGDPIQIQIKKLLLSLRLKECKYLVLEEVRFLNEYN